MDGYFVTSIAFDSKGNAWIGTFKQGIIKYNPLETVIYNSSNSVPVIAYNPRRIGNILHASVLKGYLRVLVLLFLAISAFFRQKTNRFGTTFLREKILTGKNRLSIISLYTDP
jgi:hypothetical protein